MSLVDGYWYKVKLEFPGGDYYLSTKNGIQDASGNWVSAIVSVSELVRAIDEEQQYQPQSVDITVAALRDDMRDMMAHATNSIIDRQTVTIYTMDAGGNVVSTRTTKVKSWSSGEGTMTIHCTDWTAGIDLKYPADFITEQEFPSAHADAIGQAVQQIWGRHAATYGALKAWRVKTGVFLAGAGELYNVDAIYDADNSTPSADDWYAHYDSTTDRTYIYYNSTDAYICFNCYGQVDGSSAYIDDPVDVLEEMLSAWAAEYTEFALTKNAAHFTAANTFTTGRSYECAVCLDQPESFRDVMETWAHDFGADWIINDSEELEITFIDPSSYSVARAFTADDIVELPGEEANPDGIVNKVQFFYNFDYVSRVYQDQPTYSKAASITAHGEKFREHRLLMIQDDDTALDVTQRYVARRHVTPRYVTFIARPAAVRDGVEVGDIITIEHENLLASGALEYQVLRISAADMEGKIAVSCISFDPSTDFIINSWSETGGSISPSGFTDVASGGNQTYVATPDSGYSFSAFVMDGTSYDSADPEVTDNGDGTFDFDFTAVAANHTIYVTWTLDWAGWEVTATANAYGRITPTSATGPLLYDTGDNQTFTLTPKNATYPPNFGASLLDLKVKLASSSTWTTYEPGVDAELVDIGDGRYTFQLTNISADWDVFARFTTV